MPPLFDLIPSAATSPTRRCTRSSTWAAASALVVPENDEARALELLRAHYPAAARIGRVTDDSGHVIR